MEELDDCEDTDEELDVIEEDELELLEDDDTLCADAMATGNSNVKADNGSRESFIQRL